MRMGHSFFKRHTTALLCAAVVTGATAAELFVFQFSAVFWNSKLEQTELNLNAASLQGGIQAAGTGLLIPASGGTVTIDGLQTVCGNVFLSTVGDTAKMARVEVYLSDEAFLQRTEYRGVAELNPASTGGYEQAWVEARSTGKAHSLCLVFQGNETEYRVERVALNVRPAFSLCWLRLGGFLLAGCFCVLCARRRWQTVVYEPARLSHRAVLASVMCAAVLLSCCIGARLLPEERSRDIPYPLEEPVADYGAYVQQFDAFQKGRLALDVVPDEGLALLKNPYDPTQRDAAQLSYLWDRAYFQGNYYSYYGLAPLAFYYPYYWLRGALPSDCTVALWLTCGAALVWMLALERLVRRWSPQTNLLLLTAVMAALPSGALLYMLESSADFYYNAVLSGAFWLGAAVLATACAEGAAKTASRCAFWTLTGCCAVGVVLSRPSLLLFCAVFAIAPAAQTVCRARAKRKLPWKELLCLGVPLVAGAAFVMWYNAARFGSVWEFGARYQLTVSDIRASRFAWQAVPGALATYLLQLPQYNLRFPFLRLTESAAQNAGSYLYRSYVLGLAALPLTWGCLTPRCLLQRPERLQRVQICFLRLALCAMALFDFFYGGMLVRYTADLAPTACLLGGVLFLRAAGGRPDTPARKAAHGGVLLLCGATICVGLLLVLSNERNYLWFEMPDSYLAVKAFVGAG